MSLMKRRATAHRAGTFANAAGEDGQDDRLDPAFESALDAALAARPPAEPGARFVARVFACVAREDAQVLASQAQNRKSASRAPRRNYGVFASVAALLLLFALLVRYALAPQNGPVLLIEAALCIELLALSLWLPRLPGLLR